MHVIVVCMFYIDMGGGASSRVYSYIIHRPKSGSRVTTLIHLRCFVEAMLNSTMLTTLLNLFCCHFCNTKVMCCSRRIMPAHIVSTLLKMAWKMFDNFSLTNTTIIFCWTYIGYNGTAPDLLVHPQFLLHCIDGCKWGGNNILQNSIH